MDIKIFDGSIKTSEAQYDYIMNKVGAAVGVKKTRRARLTYGSRTSTVRKAESTSNARSS